MVGVFVKLLGSGGLIAATIFVTVSTGHHSVWRYLAGVIIALPPAFQFWGTLTDSVGTPSAGKHASLEAALRAAVVNISRTRTAADKPIYPDDITLLGFHVWVVPRWYRLVFPYRLRRWLRNTFSDRFQDEHAFRPRLQRAAVYRIVPQTRSRVVFKKGTGIIGTCLLLNQPDMTLRINWGEPERKALLELRDRNRWQDAAVEITKRIKYEDALVLSDHYGQAAAMVLRSRNSDEAIGCVTLDLPRGVDDISVEDQSGVELLRELTAARDQIQEIRKL